MDDAIFLQRTALGNPDGLRVAIKDSIDLAGLPTRGASPAMADAPPAAAHAEVVQRLIDGGCAIVGKVNMHELAYGVTGINAWTGTPFNSRYPGRIPGGSSSGSAAAVAAEFADIAIGSDTGGSIRMPAACCGVFGLKPTFGLVSRRGALPEHTTLDCVGPFAANLDDLERAMELIAPGYRREEFAGKPELGVVDVPCDPEVGQAFAQWRASVAADFSTVALPGLPTAFEANITLIGFETAAAFAHLLGTGLVGADVAARLRNAQGITKQQIDDAEQVRAAFLVEVDRALEGCDALVLPAMPSVAPTLEEAGDAARAVRLTQTLRPFNLTGHPALVIPAATDAGLPFGIQFVGRWNSDAKLCALARRLTPGRG